MRSSRSVAEMVLIRLIQEVSVARLNRHISGSQASLAPPSPPKHPDGWQQIIAQQRRAAERPNQTDREDAEKGKYLVRDLKRAKDWCQGRLGEPTCAVVGRLPSNVLAIPDDDQ